MKEIPRIPIVLQSKMDEVTYEIRRSYSRDTEKLQGLLSYGVHGIQHALIMDGAMEVIKGKTTFKDFARSYGLRTELEEPRWIYGDRSFFWGHGIFLPRGAYDSTRGFALFEPGDYGNLFTEFQNTKLGAQLAEIEIQPKMLKRGEDSFKRHYEVIRKIKGYDELVMHLKDINFAKKARVMAETMWDITVVESHPEELVAKEELDADVADVTEKFIAYGNQIVYGKEEVAHQELSKI